MKEVFKMVTNIAFKADSDIINKAKTVFKKNNFSLTGALRIYLEQVALTGEVDLPTKEELEKEKLFKQLQLEVQQAYKDIEEGKGISLEEARARFARN